MQDNKEEIKRYLRIILVVLPHQDVYASMYMLLVVIDSRIVNL